MNNLKKQSVCFTGHRTMPSADISEISSRLSRTVVQLIGQGYRYFYAGGALGFDTLAEKTILQLREIYPQIRLILILPCPEQAERWSSRDREIYEQIKRKANYVFYTSASYQSGCMQLRNRSLADRSSVCICYLTQSSGGTAYTVCYAKEKELQIINLGADSFAEDI